jgi:hypothetical protein
MPRRRKTGTRRSERVRCGETTSASVSCVTPEFDPLPETATSEGSNFARQLTLHQPLQNLFQIDFAFERTGLAAIELDPTGVEAIEHLDARRRILHALRCKQGFPTIPRDEFRADGSTEDFRECDCDFIRRNAMRSFQLDDSTAAPMFLKELRRHASDIRGGDHRHGLVEWLPGKRSAPAVGQAPAP